MRIIVWGINYPPEITGIAPCNGALCEFLAGLGNDVTMLTAFPYYPAWRKEARDERKLFGFETLNSVQVVRCWHYVPSRPNALKRILHELSFVTVSFLKLLFIFRPDLLIVVSPPLLLGVAARAVCLLRGGHYLMHIQDLQPDAAIRLGMVRSRALIDFLRRAECTAYRGAWRVSAISHGMLEALRKCGVPEEKLLYFPNGVEPPRPVRVGRFREVNRFGADKFLVVYSGSLGVKQGLKTLIAAGKILRNRSIELIICGEGSEKERLLAAANGLPNVWFKGLLDEQTYQEMLADADLVVIPLAAGSGNSFFPLKLLSSCAAGKPVLAVCDPDSELAQTVRTNQCGEVVPPENGQYLAQMVDALSNDRARLKSMGNAAREFAGKFKQGKVLEQFWEQVENAVGHLATAELAIIDR
jgi:colanic acid biosynthesis glycosyl transferase WcaI